jgi:phage terminase large subunit-like protein
MKPTRRLSNNPVDHYARQVVLGRIPAGKYHRLACARHEQDRAHEGSGQFPFRFIWEARDAKGRLLPCAKRFIDFAEKLKHYKGKQWAGRPITLSDCQIFRLGSIFGWRRADTGGRRFTTAYNELPRKQGKSLEAGIVALYVTFFEGEAGAEGYTIATKRDQAKIVFKDARRLILKSRAGSRVLGRLTLTAQSIYREDTDSKLEPLGSDSDSTDGLNPSLIIVDEFHAHKNRGLIDVMETATGAREDPLSFQITTAGDDPVSPCGDQHDYACKILDRVLVDDSTEAFFAFIAHADVEDDWMTESTWKKANPHYGISVNPDDLRKLALKAKHMPSAAATFKQKRLNLWVNASAPCLSVDGWRKGQNLTKQSAEAWLAELEHESCWVGIDLASKIDLCAMSFIFPPTAGRPSWRVIQHLWTPEETLKERAHKDRAPYDVWVDQGWLKTTPGTRIDHEVIRQTLVESRTRYTIETIGFDPWHADKLIDEMKTDDGFAEEQLLAVPQTYAGMSSACLRLQADILAGLVDARGCPVTAWSVSNTVDQRDGKDNLMFVKKKSRGRIDPVVSMAIGLALWLRQPPVRQPEYQMLFFGGPRP